MIMDLAQAFRALDPLSPLEAASDYYVQRPDNPMDRVCVDLKLSDRPRHYLLAGHRGTGKTTELRRLVDSLAGKHDVHFVDLGELAELARHDPSSVLAYATARILARQPIALGVGAYEFARMLKESKDPGIDSGLDRLSWRSANDPPIVVILDGLERLAGDNDIVLALTGPVPVHTWPVSVICTIPLSAYLSSTFGEHARHFDRSIFLPGITVIDHDGVANEGGLKALSSIIRRRTGEDTFTPDALSVLALQSAGIHRELLQLAQRACVVAALEGATQVSQAHALAAIAGQRNEYSIVLRTGDFPILQDLMRSKDLPGGSDTSRLIRNQLIVAYANGTTWFDVHPILRPLVEGRDNQP